jgi:hypothetical protein
VGSVVDVGEVVPAHHALDAFRSQSTADRYVVALDLLLDALEGRLSS